MIRQLLSLLLLFIGISVATNYWTTSSTDLASTLLALEGMEKGMSIAAAGRTAAFVHVKLHALWVLLPWFVGGVLAAIVSWLGLWHWTREPEPVEKMRLFDEAGGTVDMYGLELHHDPGIKFYASEADSDALPGASTFEEEIFGVILAAGDLPYEIGDSSSVLLRDHLQATWKQIVEKHGAGSLASMLLLAHQCGKVLAFRKTKGMWTLASDKYAQQSCVVARRTRAFYKLPRQTRDDLMQCLAVLSSNWVPVDLREDLHAVIREVRIADMLPGGTPQAAQASRDEGTIDVRKIAMMVSPLLLNQFGEFNINQARSKSEAPAGIYMRAEQVLLVPPRQMREAFAKLLPPEVSSMLKLDMPAIGRHPSDNVLRLVLEATGDIVTVLKQINGKAGLYSVRSGQRKYSAMWALSAKKVKPEIVSTWGEWPMDIEVLGEGEGYGT